MSPSQQRRPSGPYFIINTAATTPSSSQHHSQPPIIRPVPLLLTRRSATRYSHQPRPNLRSGATIIYARHPRSTTLLLPLRPHPNTITHAVSNVHDLLTPHSSTPEHRRWCFPLHSRRNKQSSGRECAGTRPTSVTVRLVRSEKLRSLFPTHEEHTSTLQRFTTERL